MFTEAFQRSYASRNAFYSFGTYLTYQELNEASLRFADGVAKHIEATKRRSICHYIT